MSNTTQSTASAFVERLRGGVKKTVGALFGNEDLHREGQLHLEKAAVASQAARRDAAATHQQEKAAVTARAREVEIERERIAAAARTEQAEQQSEIEAAAAEQQIKGRHAAETAAAERRKAAEMRAAAQEQRAAAGKRAAREQGADQLDAEAERAKSTADVLDEITEESS